MYDVYISVDSRVDTRTSQGPSKFRWKKIADPKLFRAVNVHTSSLNCLPSDSSGGAHFSCATGFWSSPPSPPTRLERATPSRLAGRTGRVGPGGGPLLAYSFGCWLWSPILHTQTASLRLVGCRLGPDRNFLPSAKIGHHCKWFCVFFCLSQTARSWAVLTRFSPNQLAG